MRPLALTTAYLAPLCARALVDFTNDAFTGITVGKAFTLTWKGDGSPVTIDLMDGPTTNLAKVLTVATSAFGASYNWIPPPTLASRTYALSISQSGSTNYSPRFSISSGTGWSPSPSARPATLNTAVPSTTYPTLSSYPYPPTGTRAAFTAVAVMVMQAPLPTGNSSNSTIPPASVTSAAFPPPTAIHRYFSNSSVFPGRADRLGTTGSAVAAAAIGAGFAIMA